MNVLHKLDSLLWKLKTAAFKKKLYLQDRYGLYSYQNWIDENSISTEELTEQTRLAENFEFKPLFVFLIPVDEEPGNDLGITLQGIRAQTYPNWNVLLVGHPPENQKPDSIDSVPRVNFHSLRSGSDFPQGIIEAIIASDCDYLILSNPGDVPAPHLLYTLAENLQENSNYGIVYTDEDYLGEGGEKRLDPFFKPDWSPELMLSVNYLFHAAFRRDLLLESINQSLSERDPDYGDLTFLASEISSRIHHIPKVLYHKRAIQETTKQAILQSHCKNVQKHLTRRSVVAPKTNLGRQNQVQVSWRAPEIKTSIIIPTKDNLVYLEKCINSIHNFSKAGTYEIILVDSDSQDGNTLKYYEELVREPHIQLVSYDSDDFFNFNTALNMGASHSTGEVLLFLNNDTEIIESDWLEEMVRWAALPEIGVVGAKLLYPDDTIQQAGIVLGLEGHASHVFAGVEDGYQGMYGSVNWYRNCSAVTAACMAVKRKVFDQVGGFDEDYTLVFSDVQFCLQVLAAGYRNLYTPFARLIHHEGQSRFRYIPQEDIRLGYMHFKHIVKNGDPYYNPNLSHAVRIPTFKRRNEEPPSERLDHIVTSYNT